MLYLWFDAILVHIHDVLLESNKALQLVPWTSMRFIILSIVHLLLDLALLNFHLLLFLIVNSA